MSTSHFPSHCHPLVLHCLLPPSPLKVLNSKIQTVCPRLLLQPTLLTLLSPACHQPSHISTTAGLFVNLLCPTQALGLSMITSYLDYLIESCRITKKNSCISTFYHKSINKCFLWYTLQGIFMLSLI